MTEGAVHTQVDGSFFCVMIYSLAAWIRFLTDSAGWIRHATERLVADLCYRNQAVTYRIELIYRLFGCVRRSRISPLSNWTIGRLMQSLWWWM